MFLNVSFSNLLFPTFIIKLHGIVSSETITYHFVLNVLVRCKVIWCLHRHRCLKCRDLKNGWKSAANFSMSVWSPINPRDSSDWARAKTPEGEMALCSQGVSSRLFGICLYPENGHEWFIPTRALKTTRRPSREIQRAVGERTRVSLRKLWYSKNSVSIV